MRKIWATSEAWPFSEKTVSDARLAGAAEIIEMPCSTLPGIVAGYNEVPDNQAQNVRNDRDGRLAATDWRVIKALESGAPLAADWAAYRQALRDVPSQQGFPDDVIWPIEPT